MRTGPGAAEGHDVREILLGRGRVVARTPNTRIPGTWNFKVRPAKGSRKPNWYLDIHEYAGEPPPAESWVVISVVTEEP